MHPPLLHRHRPMTYLLALVLLVFGTATPAATRYPADALVFVSGQVIDQADIEEAEFTEVISAPEKKSRRRRRRVQ